MASACADQLQWPALLLGRVLLQAFEMRRLSYIEMMDTALGNLKLDQEKQMRWLKETWPNLVQIPLNVLNSGTLQGIIDLVRHGMIGMAFL